MSLGKEARQMLVAEQAGPFSILGDTATIHFDLGTSEGLVSVTRPHELPILFISDRPSQYTDQDDPTVVELANMPTTEFGDVVRSVQRVHRYYGCLTELDDRIAAERDFERVIEASKIKARSKAFKDEDADAVWALYNERLLCSHRAQTHGLVAYSGQEGVNDAPDIPSPKREFAWLTC